MTRALLSYHGGIKDLNSQVNLTGSSTLLQIDTGRGKRIKVVVDVGMFQGSKGDKEMNQEIDKPIIGADYAIITHAHMDHVGKLPLLVKKGFVGVILMTEISKQASIVMLNDYIRLTRQAIKDVQDRNKKLYLLCKDHLRFKNLYEQFKDPKCNKEERPKIQGKLYHLLPKKEGWKSKYEESMDFLSKHGIEKEGDIENILEPIPDLLYDEDDILHMTALIQPLEIGQERQLENCISILSADDPRIDIIPQMVHNGHTQEINIYPTIRAQIIKRWSKSLKEIHQQLQANAQLEFQNRELEQELDRAWLYYSDVLDHNFPQEEHFQKCKDFLDQYGVEKADDIESALQKPFVAPYTKEDVEKAKTLLRLDHDMIHKKVLSDYRVRFIDAGHIEGSIQALVSLTTQKIVHVIGKVPHLRETQTEEVNLLFSGDLGRRRDPNLSGSPEIPKKALDYVQLESTYAGRFHPEKAESKQAFFDAIKKAPAKVIIPAFSMQRTQEIIIMLLEKYKESKHIIEEIKVLSGAKRGLESTLKESELSPETIQRVQEEIQEINAKIQKLQKEVFDFEIVLDSPLSQKISEIYLSQKGPKYRMLSQAIQRQIFGRKVLTTLEVGEYKQLYTPKLRNKKQIIISASGMCQGGSITNHLVENLQNQLSTIVFVGYTPPNTIGGQIKAGQEVIIDNQILKINCRVEDIEGFSGHIDEAELLDYVAELPLSKNAIISLTHGGEGRRKLGEKIKEAVGDTCKKAKILVPALGDDFVIKV